MGAPSTSGTRQRSSYIRRRVPPRHGPAAPALIAHRPAPTPAAPRRHRLRHDHQTLHALRPARARRSGAAGPRRRGAAAGLGGARAAARRRSGAGGARAAAARRCSRSRRRWPRRGETETDAGVRAALAAALAERAGGNAGRRRCATRCSRPTTAPTRSAPTWRAARADAERRRARSPRSATKHALVELALAAEHAETRLAAAERVRHARSGCASSPTRQRTRTTAWPGSRASASTRSSAAPTQAAEGRRDHRASWRRWPTQPGPDTHGGDRARPPLAGARHRAATPRASRAATPRARRSRRASTASRKSSARGRGSSAGCANGSGTLEAPRRGRSAGRAVAPSSPRCARRRSAYGDAAALAALDGGSSSIAAWEAEQQAAGRRRGAGRRGRAARRRHVDRQREAARALAGARPGDAHARADAPLRGRADGRRAAPARADPRRAAGSRARRGSACTPCCTPAEQALAAGQLQAARAAADEIRRTSPTPARCRSRRCSALAACVQQLVELERWESFGQQNARVQLCERAEALADADAGSAAARAGSAEAAQRMEGARPAARRRAEGAVGALRPRLREGLRARGQAFRRAGRAAQAGAQAARGIHRGGARRTRRRCSPEPRDWRAIERWLRETDHAWREGDLGSVEPGAWKKLDARLKAALAPLRDALVGGARSGQGGPPGADRRGHGAGGARRWSATRRRRSRRSRRAGRSRPRRCRWRSATSARCGSSSAPPATPCSRRARAKRKEEDGRKHEQRRALEDLCAQARAARGRRGGQGRPGASPRRCASCRSSGESRAAGLDPALQGVESRFRQAKAAVEAVLTARARSREAAVWQTLAAKEQLCEELDAPRAGGGRHGASGRGRRRLASVDGAARAAAGMGEEDRRAARCRAPGAGRRRRPPAPTGPGSSAAPPRAARRCSSSRWRSGLDSPAELQAQRLALQVRQLRDRFQGAAASTANAPGERLVAWCAQPGVADPRDRDRLRRILAAVERIR